MSAPSLEYLRLCGFLVLPVVVLVGLCGQAKTLPGVSPNYYAVVPPAARTIDLLDFARRDPRIERIARAICRLRGIDPDHKGPPFPEGPVWELFIPEAMRFLAELDAAEPDEPKGK